MLIEVVVYSPEADDDVADSYDWYERRDSGLGEDFLRCVEACILSIQRHMIRRRRNKRPLPATRQIRQRGLKDGADVFLLVRVQVAVFLVRCFGV